MPKSFIAAPLRLSKIDVPKTLRHMSKLDPQTMENIMSRVDPQVKALKQEYRGAGVDPVPDLDKIRLLALCVSIQHVGAMKTGRTPLDPHATSDELMAQLNEDMDAFAGRVRRRKRTGLTIAQQLDMHRGIIVKMQEKGFSLEIMRRFLYDRCKVKGEKGGFITKSYLARWVRENLPQKSA